MDIKFNYNDTLSTSTSQDDLELDFSSKDKTLLSAKANEPFEFPKIAPVNTNTDINTDDVLSSSTKRNIIVNFESNEPTYVTNHTRDFYRGRSFRFAGVWTSGVHYISDEYVVDFVVKDNALLACSKSHMSSSENEPTEWIEEDGEKYAIISDYWELVISGVTGKAGEEGGVYLPSYDEENDRLVWTLVESKDLESPIYVALGLNNKIDAAIGPIQSDLNGIHSDIDNLNNNISELEVITTSISGDISGINSNVSALEQRVSDNEGNIGQLELTSSEFAVRMENAEGEVGQLKLTAHEFSVEMSNLQGDVGRLWLTAQEFGVRISNAEGDVSLLKQTADEIQTRVENAEGDVSQLHQRADEIWSQVENNQGDISRISQRADEIQSQVSNNTGDISRISQRADEISSQVENAQGDISRIEQRADSIESTVQNAQGDISQLRQTADEISSRVEDAEGNISQISQRADEISSRVENAEGSISEIRQTAEEISSTVETNKQLADNAIAENRSLISQTAEEIRTEVEQNITRLDGDIEQNRSEIRQTAEEITSTVERNKIDVDGQIESARSEIRQTADEISATVERNKQETDGSITELRSNITQTAEEIRSDVSRVESDLNGSIESARSEIRQTADEISATVERNKQEIDGSITELRSNITQTAEEINAEVSRVEQDLNGNIESARSEFRQTADEIATTVEQNKIDLDGDIAELRSNITQTAEAITATVEANKQAADGAIENLSSEIRQTAEEISATVQANKVAVDGAIEELSSNITQTAEEITATVEANKQDSDGKISQLESVQTQQADLIASKVSQTDYDADNSERETRFSIIEQTASSIESTVQANKIDADGKYIDLSTRITQTEGSITSVVNEITEINGNLLDQQSQIQQLSDEIDLKVSKTEFDNKTGSIDQSISDILLDTAGIHNTVSALSGNLDNTATAFNNYVINTNGLLEALQNQVDGAIETWYYNGAPTLSNLPASEWTTDDDKNTHIGDLYYDKTTEYAYRFMLNDGVYSWEQISDSDIATALQNAHKAQVTANSKMKVFVTTPTPPYQVGDLWVQGSTNNKDGMIYKCITPKDTGQTYSSSDWAIAFDAVTTKVIKSSFDIFADAIQGRVWQEDPNGIITGNTYSLVKQTIDNINLSVASVRNDLLATGIDISGVQYDDQGRVTQGGTVTITADNFILKGNRPNADRALTLVYDSNGVPRISATNLEVEGIFSTTPGSVWMLQKEDIKSYADDVAEDAQLAAEQNAQGFADTAEQNAKDAAQGYADDAESNAKDYTDTRETIIKNYADTVAETWATNKANAAVTSANAYVTNLLWGDGSQSDPEEGSLLDAINSEIFNVAEDLSALDGQINGPNGLAADVSNALYGISDLGYLKRALWDGDTAVAGGLIVSSLIQLGTKTYNNADTPIRNADGTATPGDLNQNTWKVWSGINGVYAPSALGHGIAAWYGGEMLDRGVSGNTDANRAAKSLFRFDGSGYLASNHLRWDASGNLTVDGYILTNEIQLKDNNGNVTAGMSGAYDNSANHFGHGIASWYGGPKIDHEKDPSAASYAKSVFRMDGSGYLAGGQISWGDTGSVVIHGATLQGSNGSITTGQLVERILEIGSWFVKEPYETVDGHTRYYLRLVCGDTTNIAGLASDGFVSAGGLSTGSGTSGIDLAAMWDSLTNTSSDPTYNNTKIHISHLPIATTSSLGVVKIGAGLNIDSNGTLTAASGTVTSIGLSMPTGFTVTSSPITENGTITVTFTSGYSLPTTASQSNWNTAYSWGNHASAGYLTDITVTSNDATIGTSLTTIASVHGTAIKAKITHQSLGLYAGATGGTANAVVASNPYILLVGGGANKGNVQIKGSGSVTTSSDSGVITISGTNTTYKLTINGTTNGDSTNGINLGSIYVPTTAGSANQILVANSSGVPTWHTLVQADVFGSSNIGSTSLPVYYNGTSGLSVINSLSLQGDIITTTKVKAPRFYLTDTIYFVVDNYGVKLEGAGFYTDSFVSAGGYSANSGTSGIDWEALASEGDEQIHRSHLSTALASYINTLVSSTSGDFVKSISKSGSTLTVTYDTFPEAVKNPHALTFGSKSYDGSEDVSLTATDLGIASWAQQSSKPSYGLSEITGTTDLRLIEALTGAGFLKRNANNTWSLDNSTYLTTSDASSTYLTITNAGNTYLTKTSASNTYLTKSDASSTYLTITDAESNYQPLDSDLTAISEISTGTGLLKRSVSGTTVTWTIDTNTYLTGNQTITLSGDVSGSGATSITTTIGEGKVTNAMLAGSIANGKLAHSSISINGTSVSLGGSFTTASITAGTAGQSSASTGAATIAIPYVTVNKYGIVTGYGTHTHTIDDLPNSALQYSSITIGSTSISLGGTSTTLAGLTKVTSTTYSAGGKLEDGTTESTITYDATNHAWKITGNIYATGFVSAGGLSNASGTSGIDWNALSTEGEDQIHRSHLVNALTGYVNNVVTSGTGDYVSSITKSGSTITVNLSTLPTTSSWSSITDKPTTLSGYGITDGVNAVTVNGSGNAVTTATISGHTLTLTKGTTFLTTHQTVTLASGTNNGTLKLTVGSTVTDNIAVKGLGAAAYKAVGSVASGNTGLVTGGDVYTAINDVVTSAIKFRGVTTSSLSDGDTSNTIIIDNESYTAKSGDLVISGGLEFLWTGTKWQLLGDESSYVPKSTTVNGHALTGNISITKSDVGLGNVTNLAASGYFTLFEMDSTDTTKTSITIGGTNKKLVIGYATKATQDGSGNTITSSYGASLGAASNALTLKAKDGTTLSTLTAANIVTVLGNTAVGRATGDKNGNDIYNTYVSNVAVGTGDNSNKLGITKAGSTTYITVPYATLANTVTTTADTSNNLYIVGVTSSATTTLKRNSSIVMKGGTLSLTSLSASTSITSPKIYLNANTYFELDANGYVHLVHPTGKGFYADGFVSAGGLSDASGTSGIDENALWELLDATNEVIGIAHIPNITTNKITDLESWITNKGYVTSSGITSVVKGTATSGGNVSTDGGTVTIQFPTAYSLPIAKADTLGGIKVGSGLSINASTGVLTATYSYTLPIASSSTLGGIKVGNNLSINATTGVLDATYTYTLPTASANVLGGIKVGSGLSIDSSTGVLSATYSYTLPLAANGTRGGIQIGYSESGTNYAVKLSSEKAYVTVPWTDTKNTAGSTDTSSKIFLIGATTQAANPQTYSDNEVYVTSGTLTTNKVQIGGTAVTVQYNSTDKCVEFIFN